MDLALLVRLACCVGIIVLLSSCASFNDKEKELETLYAGKVEFENRFGVRSDNADPHETEEGLYVLISSSDPLGFWNKFDAYQDQFGRNRSMTLLSRIVKEHGLCLLIATHRAQYSVGGKAIDELQLQAGGKESRFYHYAVTEHRVKTAFGHF
jgi:hypothetical protein